MSTEWFDAFTSIAVAPYDTDHAFFYLKDCDIAESDIQHSVLVEFHAGAWREIETTNWDCAGLCIPEPNIPSMLAVGQEGEIGYANSGASLSEDKIVPEPFRLRSVARIAGDIFACGMRREVFRRSASGQWRQIFTALAEEGELAGFESISGFSLQDIYAVGWNGEIWNFNQGAWHRIDSPTNQILTCVLCSSSGEVLICGRNGTLLRGRGDAWRSIDNESFTDDLWSIVEFNSGIYVASMKDIYNLKDDKLTPVTWGDARPATCYQLATGGDSMWSVGAKDVWMNDGVRWKAIL